MGSIIYKNYVTLKNESLTKLPVCGGGIIEAKSKTSAVFKPVDPSKPPTA